MGSSNTDSDADNSTTKTNSVEQSPPTFEAGEKVLAYHSQRFYEAKVIKAEIQSKNWQYYVHYPGWNKNWDEWVGVDRLMKHNDENVQKYTVAKQELDKNAKSGRGSHTKLKNNSVARGRKRKSDSLNKEKDVAPLEKLVNLQIPPTLKKQLVDDFEFITHLGKLVKLPRTPNVDEIIKKYLDYRLKKDGSISGAVLEITKGLCCYFNKALPIILLYKSEREQFTDAIKDDSSPSTIYGAEHLLRLFVKLPELLTYASIEDETLMELQQIFADFLKFLQKNQSAFFLSTYHVLEETETSTNRQDD